ncbi:hypothetical protein B0H11DRAFT_1929712 [Mycena galericulata]|nr:hypothetical protein B0H11DRAFT_1929712 [Mycena galericulata]
MTVPFRFSEQIPKHPHTTLFKVRANFSLKSGLRSQGKGTTFLRRWSLPTCFEPAQLKWATLFEIQAPQLIPTTGPCAFEDRARAPPHEYRIISVDTITPPKQVPAEARAAARRILSHTSTAAVQALAKAVGGKETQVSVVNYRKDGAAFVNLVSVVPLPSRPARAPSPTAYASPSTAARPQVIVLLPYAAYNTSRAYLGSAGRSGTPVKRTIAASNAGSVSQSTKAQLRTPAVPLSASAEPVLEVASRSAVVVGRKADYARSVGEAKKDSCRRSCGHVEVEVATHGILLSPVGPRTRTWARRSG